jgi:uncharacterized protein (DUF488 family)
MHKIFSIGPGNESADKFIERLEKWSIDCLVDLRSEPYSQYVPQFNRDRLTDLVRKVHIDYLYFGDRLGGRPSEGFEKYRSSPRFKENIVLLLSKIEGKTAALMCSEFDITKCHRRFIVEEIIKKGIDVIVIDKEGNDSKYVPKEDTKKSKKLKTESDSKNQSKLTGF